MSSQFPINKLNRNITHLMNEMITADIKKSVLDGLINEINLVDTRSSIQTNASIVKLPDGRYKVSLSLAFCQYVWLVCSIAIKTIDYETILNICSEKNINIKKYKEYIAALTKSVFPTDEEIQDEINKNYSGLNLTVELYKDYIYRSHQLLTEVEEKPSFEKELMLIQELTSNKNEIDIAQFSQVDCRGPYEEKINSVYCYSIVFTLLHELYHLQLGHLETTSFEKDDEISADIAALATMYSDVDKVKQFSSMTGALCLLLSLLLLNPYLTPDDEHPREDIRVFKAYDFIKNDNYKYALVLRKFFCFWADTLEIANFPEETSDPVSDVETIRKFMSSFHND